MFADPKDPVSRALFSLPTGLENALGGPQREAVKRAKQASVLFDEVIIESGLRIIEMAPSRVLAVINKSPGTLSPAVLEQARDLPEGSKTGVAVVREGEKVCLYMGTNLPRMEDASYAENDVAARYIGEYHSGILEDLARSGAAWVQVVSISRQPGEEPEILNRELDSLPEEPEDPDLIAKVELTAQEAQEFGHALADSGEVTADQGSGMEVADLSAQGFLASDLAEAIELGRRLDAIPALSGAFATVATERGVPVRLPGEESLGFMVPNFSILPWEAVAEFRDHPGCLEARERLRAFDARAGSEEAPKEIGELRATGEAVADGLFGAVKDLAPKLPDEIARPLAGTAVGLVPVVGQYASLALSMGDMIAAVRDHERFEQSWIAAIIELRDAAADATINW